MKEKEYEVLREIGELIWELKVWVRGSTDAKEIRVKICQELIDKLEEYKELIDKLEEYKKGG